MKSYTDIAQSKKLVEILPIESADMCFNDNEPCWSLAALLDVYPIAVGKDLDMYCCWQNSKNLCSKHYDNPVDACYEMILKLHEEKLI